MAYVNSLFMYVTSFSWNVSKVIFLVSFSVCRASIPQFWTCCLLATDALFMVVVYVLSAAVSGGVVLPSILICFPFNCLQLRVYYTTFVV